MIKVFFRSTSYCTSYCQQSSLPSLVRHASKYVFCSTQKEIKKDLQEHFPFCSAYIFWYALFYKILIVVAFHFIFISVSNSYFHQQSQRWKFNISLDVICELHYKKYFFMIKIKKLLERKNNDRKTLSKHVLQKN